MSFRLTAISILAIAAAATTAQADCKTDIETVLKGLESSGPYRVMMDMESAGSKSTMQGEVIMPHSMRMKGDGMEMVMTPNGVWMGQGGPLKKGPPEMKDQIQAMIKQGINLGMQAIDAPECAGSTNFEGGSFELYKYTAKADFMGISSSSSVNMYVNGDGKPEWMVVDGEAMGIKSLTKQHIIYDDSITIADPK
jgi:hypothetical protein